MLPALCVLCESTLAVPFVVLVHSLGIKPSDVPPCCFCALSSARLRRHVQVLPRSHRGLTQVNGAAVVARRHRRLPKTVFGARQRRQRQLNAPPSRRKSWSGCESEGTRASMWALSVVLELAAPLHEEGLERRGDAVEGVVGAARAVVVGHEDLVAVDGTDPHVPHMIVKTPASGLQYTEHAEAGVNQIYRAQGDNVVRHDSIFSG
mgnify:CR=1 FL=1